MEIKSIVVTTPSLPQEKVGLLFCDESTMQGNNPSDIPVTVLVSLYMGMLRESKSLQGSPQVSQLVTVLLDGIASPEHQHQHERFSELIE